MKNKIRIGSVVRYENSIFRKGERKLVGLVVSNDRHEEYPWSVAVINHPKEHNEHLYLNDKMIADGDAEIIGWHDLKKLAKPDLK